MELLSTVYVKTYKNGKNIFSVEKTVFENRKEESTYLIDHTNSLYPVPPSEVPNEIVSREDLLKVIQEMNEKTF